MKFRLFFAITHAVVAGLFLSVVVTAQATQLERSGPTIRIIKPASQAMEIIGPQSAANLECTDSVTTTTDSTIYMPIILNNYKLSLLYFDDFSDPNSGWYSGDASGCTVGYVNEQYQIIVWDPDDGLVITPDLNLPSDYRIEVDAYQASTNEGSYGLMFGIQWGVDTYEGYQIVVYPTTQDYLLEKRNMDGSWTPLIAWTNSPSINQGIETNHLRVDRVGTDIYVYINGTQVTMFTDSSFTSAGRDAGIRAYSYKDYPVYVRFDNFSVYRIP